MKNSFLRKMMSASRLTSRGKLFEASSVIQKALATAGLTAAAATSAPARAPAAARTAAATARAKSASATAAEAAIVIDAGDATDAAELEESGRLDTSRFTASSFTGATGTRAFKLFEPASSGNRALPLVVMLHGCTQNPDDFAAGTRMNALAEASGFFVLYPEQAARSNAHRCWNWFVPGDQKRGLGEPALIAGMARHVIQTHGVDPRRVYVAGLSAGGAMAAILAREYPDVFAAAGVHSGLPAGAAHDVGSAFGAMKSGTVSASAPAPVAAARPPAPLIVFHGSADATVAPANGDAVIAAALAGFPGASKTEERGTAKSGRAWRRTVWHAGTGTASAPSVAEQWTVTGAPHAWSGGASAGSFTDPDGPDASAAMLRFFLEHRQPPPG